MQNLVIVGVIQRALNSLIGVNLEPWLLVVLTLGVGIFIFLSMVEVPVYSLIFANKSAHLPEREIRFTHETLKRLTSKFPATNGLVILSGIPLMIVQGVSRSWDVLTLSQLASYLTILLVIVLVRKNPATVKSIRSKNPEKDSIVSLIRDLRAVGIDHHLGLIANLSALVIQLIIWSN
tara:strand:+ start:1351 stop:1884 length:534 start_codon:yes stop_codon:yes gene_type:complete